MPSEGPFLEMVLIGISNLENFLAFEMKVKKLVLIYLITET